MRWLSILGLETSQPKHTPEIVVQPRRVRCEHRLHRTNRNYFSSSYSRYSIVDCTQAAKIVGDHENRELKGFLKRRDEFVEIPRANRIETGCRFIEKDNLGIEGKGTRQWSALGYAARQLRSVPLFVAQERQSCP
jgi:hypothetical protein